MVDITIVNGGYFMVYKPTFTSLGGGAHPVDGFSIVNTPSMMGILHQLGVPPQPPSGKLSTKNYGKIHHAIHGKTHELFMAIFNSTLLT